VREAAATRSSRRRSTLLRCTLLGCTSKMTKMVLTTSSALWRAYTREKKKRRMKKHTAGCCCCVFGVVVRLHHVSKPRHIKNNHRSVQPTGTAPPMHE
jgi:hypothetical protein